MKNPSFPFLASGLALTLLGGCASVEPAGETYGIDLVVAKVHVEPAPFFQRASPAPQPAIAEPAFRGSFRPSLAPEPSSPRYREVSAESERESDENPPSPAEGELATAIQIYENGDYLQAAKMFRALEMDSELGPEDQATAGVYLAVSQLMCGQRDAARFTYRIVRERHPGLRQASWRSAFSPVQLAELEQP